MRSSFIFSFILIYLSSASNCFAQNLDSFLGIERQYNLVPNNSFENTISVNCRWNQNGRKYMEKIHNWDSPTETTPDIFSSTLKPSCWANPNKHSNGKQSPRSGNNMAGIKTYGKGGTDTFWHEYLMVKLDSALEPGEKYYAEIYVNRSVSSDMASNNIGMFFSDTAIITRDRMPLFITPQINSEDIVQSRWNRWQKVSGVFEANSPAEYLLIGNFYSDEITDYEKFAEGEGGAYYYVDDVVVRRADEFSQTTPAPKRSVVPKKKIVIKDAEIVSTAQVRLDSIEYRVGNTIKLENIFFEFDKAILLPQSKNELKKLADVLYDHPHLEIEIRGHTDNVGADTYNVKLSEDRAKAVVEYLIELNADKNRLSYKGFGSSMPVASNEDEKGRASNRRVEFMILKN